MSQLDRRQFVAACAGAACAACPALRALAGAASGKRAPVDVGPLAQFRPTGIYDPQGAGRRFFVVSRGGRVYAVSATCTHKSVALAVKDGSFKCPRHGSAFSVGGKVVKAPARKALPRFGMRVTGAGRLLVDPSVVFAQGEWEEDGSFIEVGT
jgi:nitrite reductase/ring-hydroxylating ferredoxin subunit